MLLCYFCQGYQGSERLLVELRSAKSGQLFFESLLKTWTQMFLSLCLGLLILFCNSNTKYIFLLLPFAEAFSYTALSSIFFSLFLECVFFLSLSLFW